jgi:hypothetical protein
LEGRGELLKRDLFESTMDPEARLYRKSAKNRQERTHAAFLV